MDLIPKPDQVLSATGNVARTVLRGGIADLRPMPRTLVDEGEHREVFHYRPSKTAHAQGDPVLLVPPLAAPALAFDLRRGCSLVEHLVAGGRPTYLVEYGEVAFHDRRLSLAPWVHEVLPAAVRTASEHAGGRPVHVVGWSLGGVLALMAAAEQPDLPIASIAALGSPADTAQVPIVAPIRPLFDPGAGSSLLARAYRLAGGVTEPLVGWASQLGSVQRLVLKPTAVAVHLDDAEWLAQIEAVGRFMGAMAAYPGRTYGQLFHRFLPGGAVDGTIDLDGAPVALAEVTAPVMVFAGATDTIAPVPAVQALVPLLTGSPEAQLEVVTGGHLGLLTGRGARTGSWPALDAWLDRWSGDDAAPADPVIGTSTARRHRSAGSRALAATQAAKRPAQEPDTP